MGTETWGTKKPQEAKEGSVGQAEDLRTGTKLCAPRKGPVSVPHSLHLSHVCLDLILRYCYCEILNNF